jgi:hypothetical protein
MSGVNLSAAYEDYAIYLPSLQQGYAAYPLRDASTVKLGEIPKGLQLSDLNFLSTQSSLWHCKYVLYSAGQFSSATISTPDIVSTRSKDTVIIGDSGGYQIGTGKLPAIKGWLDFKNNPQAVYRKWMRERGIRDTVLRWLDRYCDYAMTLDMPLWILSNKKAQKSSPFAKLSAQQLIELSVENLRYFADKRGAATGARAKYLNVLQDAGDGTGEAWYAAVKDFDFEGWAFGGDTKNGLEPILKWIRILRDDKKLDKAEWLHVLMASPPKHAVYLTAIQRILRKQLGSDIRISYDSSSPFQSAGVRQKIAQVPTLTNALRTWSIPMQDFPQSPKYQQHNTVEYLNSCPSPITQQFSINDMHSERGEFAQTFLSTAGVQLLTNHNLYVYHKTAHEACDIVFKAEDTSRIPNEVEQNLRLIENYLN